MYAVVRAHVRASTPTSSNFRLNMIIMERRPPAWNWVQPCIWNLRASCAPQPGAICFRTPETQWRRPGLQARGHAERMIRRGAGGWRVKSSGPSEGDHTELVSGGGEFVCTDRPSRGSLPWHLSSKYRAPASGFLFASFAFFIVALLSTKPGLHEEGRSTIHASFPEFVSFCSNIRIILFRLKAGLQTGEFTA
jgi:hypothetical protein